MSASQRQTLQPVVDGIHMYQVLGLRCQSSQSEVVPGRGQPLILGAPAARHLVADAVAGYGRCWGYPVNGEGVGPNVGEVQASW